MARSLDGRVTTLEQAAGVELLGVDAGSAARTFLLAQARGLEAPEPMKDEAYGAYLKRLPAATLKALLAERLRAGTKP